MDGRKFTASSTAPNSSNFARRAVSSVCHARPLVRSQLLAPDDVLRFEVAYPMKSFDMADCCVRDSS